MAALSSFVIAFFFCFFVFFSAASEAQSFDFFYFVQQWPGSYCDTKQSCCYPTTGKPAADFSIHGLWPNNDDGTYPTNCGGSYDPSLISDLKSELQAYWETLACPSGDGETFWSHEWTKHGTCSGLNEHSYFASTLNLRQNIDILGALQRAGIQADGSSYSLRAITSAIAQGVGQTPGIECNRNSSGERQLYQVYICVDKDAQTVIECPVFPSNTACGSEVVIPSF